MQLFYIPNLDENSKTAIFSSDESRHLFKVLRKKVGDVILITNGNHLMFTGNISAISKNNCEVEISKCEKKEKLGYSLHIVISILKSKV
jgi:16S rRNA (uracil1498-N3)-methyltransferase